MTSNPKHVSNLSYLQACCVQYTRGAIGLLVDTATFSVSPRQRCRDEPITRDSTCSKNCCKTLTLKFLPFLCRRVSSLPTQ